MICTLPFFISCDTVVPKTEMDASTRLFFNKPATNWHEAIPIGNGRLGGMVFGGTDMELVQTNEDTFWSGEPRDLQKPGAHQCLLGIRQLLLEDKTAEAQKLIDQTMLGEWNQSYMPLADILLHFDKDSVSNYSRELDLTRGVITIRYQQNGVTHQREIFASYPDQAIVIRMTNDKKHTLHFSAGLDSRVKHNTTIEDNQVIIRGNAPKHVEPKDMGKFDPIYEEGHGMRFEGRLCITQTDGDLKTSSDALHLADASYATLVFTAATSYNGFDKDPYKNGKDEKAICRSYLKKLEKKDYKEIYSNHILDYGSLFNRVSINLGNSSNDQLPLNERIAKYTPQSDPSLTALYYQFGRYLLISASRAGTQPSNLQGIWNKDLQPAWCANWTINCNTELNYWPVETGNLSECHLPLVQMTREAMIDGAKTAQNLYNARGWVAHHNLDIWRTTWPVDGTGLWAIYQVGGAWLCQHIWEHYQFTLDKVFLKENYDILREATLFYLDNLQKDKEGYLVTNPSESFENSFVKPNGEGGWACVGSAQDMQIIRSLFKNTMATIDILGTDKDFKEKINVAYQQLAPIRISPRTGQLQEWNDDWDPAGPHNGQVAIGWGFAASDLITLRGTPELAEAFRKTIEYRKPWLSYNSGSWTGSFPANYWARFEEGDSVQMVIDRHFEKALFPNLTSQFFNTWQIDGNLGMTAAIGETLLQSHAGEISLLPALPSKYPNGWVKGLKARGNYEIDIYWKDGKLEKVFIKSSEKGEVNVRYKEHIKVFPVNPTQVLTLTLSDFTNV